VRSIRSAGVVVLTVLGGCRAMTDSTAADASPTTGALLFPLNVAPDVVVDTAWLLVCLPCVATDPSPYVRPVDGWPALWLLSPLVGPVWGIVDASQGRPFWHATADRSVEFML
jgi:hypothetical protein